MRAASCPGRAPAFLPWLVAGALLVVCAHVSASAAADTLHLRANGVPLEIHPVHSREAPEVLLARYRDAWSRSAPLSRQRIAGWQVLGRQIGSRHETLQVRSDGAGGSEGFLASSDLAQPPARLPSLPIELARGAQLLRTIESSFGDLEVTEFLARSPEPVAMSLQRAMRSAWLRGFRYQESASRSSAESGAALAHLIRGPERLALLVQRSGTGSSIWIHHEIARQGHP